VGKPLENVNLENGEKCEDNINMYVRKILCEDLKWMELTQNRA
jgi:predicted DNA-binding antitoxin AbrB/MazE fold protein